jgi:3-oxoacyl-(acyl-carrier-protein) synthase/NAD(P)H-dependent flavin oxidoreductase YrpB (nitropropane dioxygenase family)
MADAPSHSFQVVVATLPGWPDPAVAIAGSRAGATGLLNLEDTRDAAEAVQAIEKLVRFGRGALGVKLRIGAPLVSEIGPALPSAVNLVVLAGGGSPLLDRTVEIVRAPGRRVFVECTSTADARRALASSADGIVAKGHEAGGSVGDETTFVLVQAVLAETDRPVLACGGIGLSAAAACYAAGCAGVVIDIQVALARESTLPAGLRDVLESMEGDETLCLGAEVGDQYRVYYRPGVPGIEPLQQLAVALGADDSPEAREEWRRALQERLGWERSDARVWPLGQDGTFAAPLARRFRTVSGIVEGLRRAVAEHVRLAQAQRALDCDAPLARAHGTRYPILQGPMTRVSDTPAFAEAVAAGGALPFLALALLRAPQVRALLEETGARLGSRPWGVGILGFVPPELRREQLDVIQEIKPRFAIIAGGRPDQASRLESCGIPTYLHVPAPGLLRVFLEDGARRFIFEGRECGGHVGPRTSFVLWQAMIDALGEAIDRGVPAGDLHIVFAGGIHDAVSAAMVATMAAGLVARGVRIGVLLGTAYLFTEEAVATRAIVEGFQREAVECSRTVLLDTGPGHSTRCVETPFCATFRATKRRLIAEGRTPDEIRTALEKLNLGRLRIASKGLARVETPSQQPLTEVEPQRQREDGMFMIGQVAALRTRVCRIADLHEDVTRAGAELLARVVPPVSPLEAPAIERARPSRIAIVGMGCLLPAAPDLATFWSNILNKVDAVTEVPKGRFDIDLYYDPDRKARDKVYSRWGGFLADVPFDPIRYGIPPATLPSIDPLQLLSLEVVRQALADAGYLDRPFARERTAVILGISGGLGDVGLNYGLRASLPALFGQMPAEAAERLPEWTEDSFAGILLNVAAGRVANRFDLGGVNYTVDAACASSLAAVYLAVGELEGGTSDMVIVGGVDTVQSPFGFLCFSKSQALSPRGRCRTFDAEADGIAISEGLTMLVLKRLDDAERDGDRIYAVLQGIAGSSDGRGRSLTAPRPEGQTRALERAYARAGVSPATVGLIEAHGTGTVDG